MLMENCARQRRFFLTYLFITPALISSVFFSLLLHAGENTPSVHQVKLIGLDTHGCITEVTVTLNTYLKDNVASTRMENSDDCKNFQEWLHLSGLEHSKKSLDDIKKTVSVKMLNNNHVIIIGEHKKRVDELTKACPYSQPKKFNKYPEKILKLVVYPFLESDFPEKRNVFISGFSELFQCYTEMEVLNIEDDSYYIRMTVPTNPNSYPPLLVIVFDNTTLEVMEYQKALGTTYLPENLLYYAKTDFSLLKRHDRTNTCSK